MNPEFEAMIRSIKANNPKIDKKTLDAFKIIDRKFFMKSPYVYEDEAIHIEYGQTISQPTTIARMMLLLQLEKGDDVLEIGTNTGYHASLVSYIISPSKVTSIEIFKDLAQQAQQNIKKLNKDLKKNKIHQLHIDIIAGDALDEKNKIWSNKYDKIYFTAGIEKNQREQVKSLSLKSLKDKGLLLFPTRENFDYGNLELWQKQKNELKFIKIDPGYAFVPLIKGSEMKDTYKKSNHHKQ